MAKTLRSPVFRCTPDPAAVRVSVLNNLTIEANRGLAVFASRPISRPTDGVVFSDIVIRTRLMPGHWWGKAEPIYISVQPCDGPCGGGVKNVVFSNIEADAEAGIMIAGAKGLPVENVQLHDVRLRMITPDRQLSAAIGGNFDRRWTAPSSDLGIVTHDIPAISCEDTRNLSLRNLEVHWDTDMPSYSTAAVDCQNFDHLDIDGLEETGSAPKSSSSIVLKDGRGQTLERLKLANTRPQILRSMPIRTAGRHKKK